MPEYVYAPTVWNAPMAFSAEVEARLDEPVRVLMDKTARHNLYTVRKQDVITDAPKPWQRSAISKTPGGHLAASFYDSHWDAEDTHELTILRTMLVARAIRYTVNKPIIQGADPLTTDMMYGYTLGEIAYIAARSKESVVQMGRVSATGWWNITSRMRGIVEPNSALAWNIYLHSYPSWEETFGKRSAEWMAEATALGLGFDEFQNYVNAGVPKNMILEAVRDGIDPELFASVSVAA